MKVRKPALFGTTREKCGRGGGIGSRKTPFPAYFSYLCFFQQIREDGEPVGNEHLQLQGDDGQGQRGASELPELVAGHTVLHLPGPQHRLEARRRLLKRSRREQAGARGGVPGHACAKPDGRNEVRVAGDEQGMELDRGEGEKGEKEDKTLPSPCCLTTRPSFTSTTSPTSATGRRSHTPERTFTLHREPLRFSCPRPRVCPRMRRDPVRIVSVRAVLFCVLFRGRDRERHHPGA